MYTVYIVHSVYRLRGEYRCVYCIVHSVYRLRGQFNKCVYCIVIG